MLDTIVKKNHAKLPSLKLHSFFKIYQYISGNLGLLMLKIGHLGGTKRSRDRKIAIAKFRDRDRNHLALLSNVLLSRGRT